MILPKLKICIAIPTYNGGPYLATTLKSILSQSYNNFQIVVSDDHSKDDTLEVVESFRDKRIKIHKNRKNLGYGANLQALTRMVDKNDDILFLMGQDDILLKDALLKTALAFARGENIGLVTRPYYWFYDKDFTRPVREAPPYNPKKDEVISIFDGEKQFRYIFMPTVVGQLSGLAYRLRYWDRGFHTDTFVAHVYPFASIAKRYSVVALKDYTVAVRIASSQSRSKSSIYDISPLESWVRMYKTIFPGEKYRKFRHWGIEFISSTNFVGLVQIKNFSTFGNLLREIFLHLKYHWLNFFNPVFWFFAAVSLLTPSQLLIRLVDEFKNKILSRRLKYIKIIDELSTGTGPAEGDLLPR